MPLGGRDMRRWLRLLLPFCLLVLAAGEASAAKKVGLVIGNDIYENLDDLQKAVADAQSYAGLLQDQGFAVTLVTNATRQQMDEAIAGFIGMVEPGDTAAFVYSGHGWSDGLQNYLVSVDMPASGTPELLARLSVPVRNGATGILDELDRRGAAVKIAILDACRDNPFQPLAGVRSAGLSRGLVRVEPPEGTFLVFSAAPGQSALDRLSDADPNPNSVFTRVFVPLVRQGMSLQDAIKSAQGEVVALARGVGHDQRPTYVDEMLGETCLGGLCSAPVLAGLPGPAAGVPAGAGIDNPEALFWLAIQNSANPADFRAYLEQFPGGLFSSLANSRIAMLTPPAAPLPPPGGSAERPAAVVAEINECDLLAASRTNPDNPPGVAGVADIGANAAKAAEACEIAVKEHPEVRRFWYQLGRANGTLIRLNAAIVAYQKAADLGSGEAMRYVGLFYERGGGGLPQDYAQALDWYRRSADTGFGMAINDVGRFYENGHGVPQDYGAARDWYGKAAAAGVDFAMNNLAILYQRGRGGAVDLIAARGLYLDAAGRGYAAAMLNLGYLYENALGVPRDYTAAREWYQRGADAGDTTAMAHLGRLYEQGIGVPVDYAKAAEWYQSSALIGGDLEGMYGLARLADAGRGRPVDHQQAAGIVTDLMTRGYERIFDQLRELPNQFSREVRVAVQDYLIRQGHLSGGADGAFGPRTIAALTAYQSAVAAAN